MSMVNHGRVVGPIEAGMIARAAAARARLMGGQKRLSAPVATPSVVEPVIYQQPAETERSIEQAHGRMTPRQIAFAIVHRIALENGVSSAQVFGRSRSGSIRDARHEAVFEIHVTLGWSLPRTGRFFGRDHTTALNSIRTFKRKHPDEAQALIERVRVQEERDAELRKDVISEIADRCGLLAHEVGLWADEE